MEENMVITDLAELTTAAKYKAYKNIIKSWGGWSIFIGICTIGYGVFRTILLGPVNIVVILTGLFWVGLGIGMKTRVFLPGLLILGVVLLVGEIENAAILAALFSAFSGKANSYGLVSGILLNAVWIVAWAWLGVKALLEYKKYSSHPVSKPTDEALKTIDDLFNSCSWRHFKKESDVIMFRIPKRTIGKSSKYWDPWQGKLTRPYSMAAQVTGRDIQIFSPEDMEIITDGSIALMPGFGKWENATFTINQKTYHGAIDTVSIERYQAWKNTP
jgi:hypothetical protein